MSVTDDLAETIRRLPPSAGRTVVIGIDGCGGAGKSTLAAALVERIEGAAVIHTDDFASWDRPIEWWPRLLEEVLLPLSKGEVARFQRYDWITRSLAEWQEVNAPIIILEGVGSTRLEFRQFLAFRVWVDCPRAERLQRGLERDGVQAEGLWRTWMRAEDAYRDAHRPKENADRLVYSGTGKDHGGDL